MRGDDKTVTNTVSSNLKRELRMLGDVDIVGYADKWNFLIDAVPYIIEKQKKRSDWDAPLQQAACSGEPLNGSTRETSTSDRFVKHRGLRVGVFPAHSCVIGIPAAD